MSKPLREQILSNPRLVLSEFNNLDILTLQNNLKSTANQILCKFGYMQRTDKDINTLTKEEVTLRGYDKYTLQEVFERMPNETKIMFWSINNASYLIEIEKRLRLEANKRIDNLTAENLKLNIELMKLQEKLNK